MKIKPPIFYPGSRATNRTTSMDKNPVLFPKYIRGRGGYPPEYFAQMVEIEENSFWFRNRNRLILWALHKYFPEMCSFLEIGCGTGFVLSGIADAFPDVRLSGSEIFVEGLEFAAKRLKGVELMQMDARRIPYADEFDAIGAFDVLEHIKEDLTVLQEIYRALKPGGGLVLTVPQHPFLWSSVDESALHVRRYLATDLQKNVSNT